MLFPFSFMKTVPVVPVATAATGVGSTSFTANWNAFSGASYYLLDVSLSSSFSTFVLQNTVTTATSYVVTGLTPSTTYYYRVRAAINVDSDVAGFVSRVYAAGGSLSYTEVTATETLVADLKSYGIWTAMRAVYPMVGASASACAQNLVSSSFTGTFSSGWTFSSTGVTPNGTSAYMNTNYLESGNASNNNVHLSFYSRTQTLAYTTDKADIGAVDTSTIGFSNIYTLYNTITSAVSCQSILTSAFIPNTSSLGFFVGNRTTSTDLALFIRNTKNTATINSSNLLTIPYYIGARNLNNSSNNFSDRQCAFASMGLGLTDTQAASLYTCVQTFNTSLSRQV